MRKPTAFRQILILAVAVMGMLVGVMLAHGGQTAAATPLAACTPTGATYGTDSFSVTNNPPNPVVITSATTYHIWVRAEVPAVSSASPLLLNLDNATGSNCYALPGSAFTTAYTSTKSAWTWVEATAGLATPPTFTQANHTLLITGTQAGVGVDRIEFLNDSTCNPNTQDCTTASNTAPTVSVTAPTNGATVGSTVNVTASATATQSGATISSVQFQIDGVNVGSADTVSPYTYSWNTASLVNGSSHTLTAIAKDSNGLSTTSGAVTVTVKNGDTTPPTVSLTTPTNNQTVKGTVAVAATATDNVGVTKVQFYVDGVLASSVVSSPYSYSWDTTKVANGSHVLRATAYDAAGNVGNSQITVIVQNADTQAPSKPAGVTATAASAAKVNLGWTASTDNVGVTGYYILRSAGGSFTTIGQVGGSTTTYTDTTVAANSTYSYEIEAFDAAGNVSLASATASVTTPNPADTTPPSQPTNLKAAAASSSQINLSWTASTDNIGVTGYDIYRNGVKLITVTGTSFGNTGLSASTTYSYYVVARDGAGNSSLASTTVSATTPAATTTNTLQGVVTDAATHNPIPAASVGAYYNGWNFATANSAGQYLFAHVTANKNYTLSFSKVGYNSQSGNITVSTGTTVFNAALTPKP